MSDGSNPAGMLGKELAGSMRNFADALRHRAMSALNDKVTERLASYAGQDGGPGTAAAGAAVQKLKEGGSPASAMLSAGMTGGKQKLGQAMGKGGGKGSGKKFDPKVTNIIESIDVGAPVRLVYNQWTTFKDFPSFTKKVEGIEQKSDEKLTWRAQVLWSHRSWESTIVEQVPDERIVWQSKGDKGWVDGSVSFHELAPDLTRIMLVMEYHPKGFFEQTGNIWRAQGRRVRLELKHFVRHVMRHTVLHPEEARGWRGEIRDCKVVQDDQSARQQEGGGQQEGAGQPQAQPQAQQQAQPQGAGPAQGQQQGGGQGQQGGGQG